MNHLDTREDNFGGCRRLAMLDTLDDRCAKLRMPSQLTIAAAALLRPIVGRHAEIAGQIRHLPILELVARDLAENRRAMAAKLLGVSTLTPACR